MSTFPFEYVSKCCTDDKRIEGEISMYRLFVKNCSLISRGSRVNCAHLLVANKNFFFFLYHVILYHVFDNNDG